MLNMKKHEESVSQTPQLSKIPQILHNFFSLMFSLTPSRESDFSTLKCRQEKTVLKLLAGITLLAVALRLLGWYLNPVITRDGIFYIVSAETWGETGSFKEAVLAIPKTKDFPLLYTWLLQLGMRCGLTAEITGRFLGIVLGSLLPLITYLIARQCVNNVKIALGAALLMAVHPIAVELSYDIIRDTLYLFLIGWTIYLLLRGIKTQLLKYWLGAGIVFSLAFLTRYETLEFLPLLAMYFLVSPFFKSVGIKKALKNAVGFTVCACCCFLLMTTIMGVPLSFYGVYSSRVEDISTRIFDD